MNTHKLTKADAWYVEKGQIDPLSRTPFEIGHEVVVCENKHVLLADFYDGTCPVCGSRITVPFTRQNIEHTHRLKLKRPSNVEFLHRFLPTSFLKKIIPKVNIALICILVLTCALAALIIFTGELPVELIYTKIEKTAIPRTEWLLDRASYVGASIASGISEPIRSGTVTDFINASKAYFRNVGTGFQDLVTMFAEQIKNSSVTDFIDRSKECFGYIGVKFVELITLIEEKIRELLQSVI